jgi:hypothetical protein
MRMEGVRTPSRLVHTKYTKGSSCVLDVYTFFKLKFVVLKDVLMYESN